MADGPNVGFATLSVIPSLRGAQAALSGGIAGPAASAGATGGRAFSGAFTKVLGGAALATGAVIGLEKIGSTFDDVSDTIRTGTGATGDALAGLEDSFNDVVSNVPAGFGDAATAIADLNTRLGLTGDQLEDRSTQFLELSRITGTDLAQNVETVSRVFGDWGVAVSDQGDALDGLFRASQATGPSVDRLGQLMVQFGSPLRQLGFGFDETAALLGKFEKEGVNTELVMGSMRIALGKMARDGEPAEETLARVTDEIANAGDVSEANAKALELFGARAGPDMAAAIREGRFEVGDLLDTVANGSETILGAADDTNSWRESLSVLRNKALVKLEPVATKFFDLLGTGADTLSTLIDAFSERGIGGALGELRDRFDGLSGPMKVFTTVLAGLGAVLAAAAIAASIGAIVGAVAALFNPVTLIVAAIAGLAAGLVYAYQNFEGFRNVVDGVIGFITDTVIPAIETAVAFIADQFGNLVGWVQEHWGAIEEAISHVLNVIEAYVQVWVDAVLLVWEYFGDTILAAVEFVWDTIMSIVEFAVDTIAGVIEAALAIINGDWGDAWDAIVGIFRGAWDLIGDILTGAVELYLTFLGDAFDAMVDLVSGALEGIVDFFSDLPGDLADAAGDVFGFLWEAFKSAVNLIIDGWNALEFKIPSFDPPGPGPTFGGFTLGVPDIPRLHDGGLFTVHGGGEGFALLEDGEIVLTPPQYDDLARSATGGAPMIGRDLVVQVQPGEDPWDRARRELDRTRMLAGL